MVLRLPDLVDHAHIWMFDACGGARFGHEHVGDTSIAHELGMNALDDDELLEATGSEAARKEQVANVPPGKFCQQGEAPKAGRVTSFGRCGPQHSRC